MSLIHFHRFLIASAIIFCVGFGIWTLSDASSTGSIAGIALALAFFAAAAGLAYYLARLRHFLNLPPQDGRGRR